MTKLAWDRVGERRYETGVDHGVLYLPNAAGSYDSGFAWNGLVSVTESPTGAEPNPQYADNIKYLNLKSVEEFGATIEAFTYPDEFGQCDGTAEPVPGVALSQQPRKSFGLSWRTRIGNDLNPKAGYKIHLVYNADAAPSERPNTTVNDSPEAITFSWELTTTSVEVGEIEGVEYDPTSKLTIDSTKVDAAALADLEDALYGTAGSDPRLPTPAEVVAMFASTITVVNPTEPGWDSATDTLTIPTVTGVDYLIDGEVQAAGPQVLTERVVVTAKPKQGYKFPSDIDTDWGFDPAV